MELQWSFEIFGLDLIRSLRTKSTTTRIETSDLMQAQLQSLQQGLKHNFPSFPEVSKNKIHYNKD